MVSYYYLQLPEHQKQLYDHIRMGLGQRQIPCAAVAEEIHSVIKAVLMDHPELCFFEGKWKYQNGTIYPYYGLAPAVMQDLLSVANAIEDNISLEDYPRQIYAWMLTQIAYDPGAPNSQNAYGALVQHRAACKGIAKAYQLLMAHRNITCILVEGTLDGKTKHVWNMIHYMETWRHVDVTMGYPCFRPLVNSVDEWGGYLLPSETIARSHRIRNPENLPI